MSLAGIATTVNNFMHAGPDFPWGLVCVLLVGIPVTLLHELGHAAAGARLGYEVRVTVGNAGRIGTVRFGRLTTTLNVFQMPTRVAGEARFDTRRATAQDMLWISLAGPAASLAGGVVVDIAYRHAAGTGITHALLWAAVFDSVFAVANLIPLRLRERRGGPTFNTDGMWALSALVMMFAGRSRETAASESRRPAATPTTPTHARPDRAEIGVRVWRHDDHLHIGVGPKQEFEAPVTAAVTSLSPASARGLAQAILDLADEAEDAASARAAETGAEPRPADPDRGSVAPPGYSG